MGKHYVPQAHLRRFQIDDSPGFVWMYDKKTGEFVKASISKVAQEPDFYSQDTERVLAGEVELPGNTCIDRLLRGERLDNAERTRMSLYMMVMATRGPRHRKKALNYIPGALESLVDDWRKAIERWMQEKPEGIEKAKTRLRELDDLQEKYSKEIPQQTRDLIRTPFWSDDTVGYIHNMAWHILPAPASEYFVTSDTPAHFFEGLGIGNADSEFTFPISKSHALIGEHGHSWGMMFEKPQSRLVREVNRRILSHSERFVFSPRKDAWIKDVARKATPHLSQIRWK